MSKITSLAKSIRARAPIASSPRVRKVMQATPSRDTAPERALRSALHRMGLRFLKNKEPASGIGCKADVIFQRAKVCVFMDGCFWHGCPKHFRAPKTNTEWWLEKVRDNQERDKKKTNLIKKQGWVVLRYWEHDTQRNKVIKIARKIFKAVRGGGSAPLASYTVTRTLSRKNSGAKSAPFGQTSV